MKIDKLIVCPVCLERKHSIDAVCHLCHDGGHRGDTSSNTPQESDMSDIKQHCPCCKNEMEMHNDTHPEALIEFYKFTCPNCDFSTGWGEGEDIAERLARLHSPAEFQNTGV